MPCTCDPVQMNGYDYVQWMGDYFGACVYTPRDVTAFWLGLANIGCWLFAQAPQLYKNYKTQTAESLSGIFLVTWLAGDITNLIGCILTQQLPTQLYTAYYFLCMDVLMLSQYAYYTFWKKTNVLHQEDEEIWIPESASPLMNENAMKAMEQEEEPESQDGFRAYAFGGFALLGIGLMSTTLYSFSAPIRGPSRVLLQTDDDADLCDAGVSVGDVEFYIGCVSAWLSGVLYFGARFPQIIRNQIRRTTEGLSLSMFALATTANVFYGLSLCLPDTQTWGDNNFWNNVFPYLLGSIGTIASTIPILVQFYLYRGNMQVYPEAVVTSSAKHIQQKSLDRSRSRGKSKEKALHQFIDDDYQPVNTDANTSFHEPKLEGSVN